MTVCIIRFFYSYFSNRQLGNRYVIGLAGRHHRNSINNQNLLRQQNMRHAFGCFRQAIHSRIFLGGQQNNLFALFGIRKTDRSMMRIRPSIGRHLLNGGQRDHFAADFGKTLAATADTEEAFIIDMHNIAGVIPATCANTATVRRPSSVPARKMRTAISLRLAAMIFLIERMAGASGVGMLRKRFLGRELLNATEEWAELSARTPRKFLGGAPSRLGGPRRGTVAPRRQFLFQVH